MKISKLKYERNKHYLRTLFLYVFIISLFISIHSYAAADVTAPTIDGVNVKVNKTNVTSGDTIVISVPVTDDYSGVYMVGVHYVMPVSKKDTSISMTYNEKSNMYEAKLEITDDWESGVWKISDIEAFDNQRNHARIYNSNTNSGSYNCVDMSGGDFKVSGTTVAESDTESSTVFHKGEIIGDNIGWYKVISSSLAGGELEFLYPSGDCSEVTICSTTIIDGVTYKVTSIAADAFRKHNRYLKKIVIEGSNIKTIGSNAFRGCRSLETVILGDGVSSIGDNAFLACDNLKTVKMGKDVTIIGSKAFFNCKKLTSITIPSKVKKIGKEAFRSCLKLKSVTIGANVTTIDDNAFYRCTSLSKITIPAKVSKIGKSAFCSCEKLKTITIKSKKLKSSKIGKNAFKGIKSNVTIKAPKSKLKTYKDILKKKGVSAKAKFKKL